MEQILLLIAGWLGRNIGFLGTASLAALGAFAITRALQRLRGLQVRGLVPLAFLGTFSFAAVRNAWGYSLYLTGDERSARSTLLILSAFVLAALAVLVIVRMRTRVAAIVCAVSVVLVGFAHPFAETRAQSRSGPQSVSTPAPMPAAYPRVQIWTNSTDNIAAAFPSEPRRVDAAAQGATGYAYQAAFQFEDGGALASIQVSPTDNAFQGAGERSFLLGAHESFVRTLGAAPDDAASSWDQYGDGRLMLRYAVRFSYEGTPIIGLGFWMLDGRRALRVSVAYPEALSSTSQEVAEYFLSTFLLLSK